MEASVSRPAAGSLTWPLGMAIAAGVPALALISAGPVAALAGPPSVLVWALAGLAGVLMAVTFGELVSLFPGHTGGIAVAAAQALRSRSRPLALLAQWGYWLGWSPTMAITATLAGQTVRRVAGPEAPGWVAWVVAAGVLAGCAAVNRRGIAPGAWLQSGLAVCTAVTAVLLIAPPLTRRQFDVDHLLPFAPPGGWLSRPGLTALAGAFFLAGWSAYGAEVALSYASEYRHGTRAVIRSLLWTGVVTAGVFALVPLVLVGTLGVAGVSVDPIDALVPLVSAVAAPASLLVAVLLVGVLVLASNMIAIASSRVLYQMALDGDAPAALGRLNRQGVPGVALGFDLGVALLLLGATLALNGGDPSRVPVALLAAANVGYFVCVVLALVATWMMRRDAPEAERPFRAPRGFVGAGLALAGFNSLLVAGAGAAWGWRHVGLGAVALVAVVVLLSPARVRQPERAPAPAAT